MPDGGTIATPPNQLVSAADILAKLAPTFIGSGEETGTSTATSGQGIQQLLDLFNQSSSNASDPLGNLGPVLNNIFTMASNAFAPVAGQQNASGMYNTSTLQMLSAMASGQASQQSAQAVTDYITNQQKIAAQAATSLTGATATKTTTAQTAPAINPLTSIATIGGGILASKLANSGVVNRSLDAIGLGSGKTNALTGTTNPVAATPSLAIGSDPSIAATSADVSGSAAAGLPTDVGNFSVGGGAASLSPPSIPIPDASDLLTLGQSFDPAAAGGTTLLSNTIGDVAPDAADAATSGGIGGAFSDAGTAISDAGTAINDNVIQPVIGAVGDAASGVGDAISSIASDASWIICTELVRQKRMPLRYYISGAREFAGYWEYGKRGYYIWAIPAVRHLRKYPNSHLSKVLEFIFNKRAEHIAALAGVRSARRSILGAAISSSLWYICAFLAVAITPFCRDPDWLALYPQEKN